MKIHIYYTFSGDAVRVWNDNMAEYGMFEVVDYDTFERMRVCEFLTLVEVSD